MKTKIIIAPFRRSAEAFMRLHPEWRNAPCIYLPEHAQGWPDFTDQEVAFVQPQAIHQQVWDALRAAANGRAFTATVVL